MLGSIATPDQFRMDQISVKSDYGCFNKGQSCRSVYLPVIVNVFLVSSIYGVYVLRVLHCKLS